MESLKNNINKEKIIIMIMIVSVFIGIYYTLESWLKSHTKEWRSFLTASRLAETEKLATNSNQQYFIISKILPLLKYICETENVNIEELQQSYLNEYDLDLSIYLFDENGILEKTAPKRAPNQWLMKNLFPYLLEKDIEKINEGKKLLDKKIEFTFGYGKNLISLKENPEIIINSVTSGCECFFSWSKRPQKGVLIFGNRLPNPDKILEKALSITITTTNKDLVFAGKIKADDKSEQNIIAKKANDYFMQKSVDNGLYNEKEWYFATDKNGDKYYTVYKIATSIYSKSHIFLQLFFAIIIPLALLVIKSISRNSILNLKKMVILIFLASSLIPISAINAVNQESIDAFYNIYVNEIKSSMEEAIRNVIQHFGNYITSSSKKLNDLTSPQEMGNYDLKDMEKKVTEAFPNSKFSARDSACNIVYANFPGYSAGQEALFKSLAHEYLLKFNQSRIDEKPYKGNPFADALMKKDDMGLSILTQAPNRLQYIYNTGTRVLLFTKLLPKEAGDAALLFIFLNLPNTIKDYIKNIDKRTLIANHEQIKLTAFNPNGFKWIIPPPYSNNQLLEQAKAAFVLGKPIFRMIIVGKKILYVLCVPNSDIYDICYLGALPIDTLLEKILKMKFHMDISAIMALFLLISIIVWLMKQIITPLSDLEVGIQALEKRNFETKIPVPPGNDELVKLFKEFNFMMGENYDMQLAKNVQEGLITKKFPECKGYVISGISIPANNLGGDCLTSFSLPDGEILFLIGDLTGHSIGSALMMAFVRSVTFNWSQCLDHNPIALVSAIDQMLRDNKIEKMFMGIVCGVLNPINGKINFITNGHIYPLFLRNDGTTEWLGMPSLPLGIGHQKEIIIQETNLLPGERLLCISDGLIEINSNGGMTTGYDTIEKWANESKNTNSNEWVNKIKTHFDEWCLLNKAEQTDDITIFGIINEGTKE